MSPEDGVFHFPNTLQIIVQLDDIEPAVWRRLVVPMDWRLDRLHLVIQAAFNWWNYHLHEFNIGGLKYGDLESLDGYSEDDPRLFDEQDVRLRDFDYLRGVKFRYLYDFGDCWNHTVEVETAVFQASPLKHAECIAGADARPPEDVGGTGGYAQFLAIMADKADMEYAATKAWCGGHFDPAWFDLAICQKDVRNALKSNVKRKLHPPHPARKVGKENP